MCWAAELLPVGPRVPASRGEGAGAVLSVLPRRDGMPEHHSTVGWDEGCLPSLIWELHQMVVSQELFRVVIYKLAEGGCGEPVRGLFLLEGVKLPQFSYPV